MRFILGRSTFPDCKALSELPSLGRPNRNSFAHRNVISPKPVHYPVARPPLLAKPSPTPRLGSMVPSSRADEAASTPKAADQNSLISLQTLGKLLTILCGIIGLAVASVLRFNVLPGIGPVRPQQAQPTAAVHLSADVKGARGARGAKDTRADNARAARIEELLSADRSAARSTDEQVAPRAAVREHHHRRPLPPVQLARMVWGLGKALVQLPVTVLDLAVPDGVIVGQPVTQARLTNSAAPAATRAQQGSASAASSATLSAVAEPTFQVPEDIAAFFEALSPPADAAPPPAAAVAAAPPSSAMSSAAFRLASVRDAAVVQAGQAAAVAKHAVGELSGRAQSAGSALQEHARTAGGAVQEQARTAGSAVQQRVQTAVRDVSAVRLSPTAMLWTFWAGYSFVLLVSIIKGLRQKPTVTIETDKIASMTASQGGSKDGDDDGDEVPDATAAAPAADAAAQRLAASAAATPSREVSRAPRADKIVDKKSNGRNLAAESMPSAAKLSTLIKRSRTLNALEACVLRYHAVMDERHVVAVMEQLIQAPGAFAAPAPPPPSLSSMEAAAPPPSDVAGPAQEAPVRALAPGAPAALMKRLQQMLTESQRKGLKARAQLLDGGGLSRALWCSAQAGEDDGPTFLQLVSRLHTADLSKCSPQQLARILWACASADRLEPAVADVVCGHIMRLADPACHDNGSDDDVAAFAPEDLSNILWAVVKADCLQVDFVERVSGLVACMDLGQFTPGQLSHVLVACVKADLVELDLAKQLFRRVLNISVASLTSRELKRLASVAAVAEATRGRKGSSGRDDERDDSAAAEHGGAPAAALPPLIEGDGTAVPQPRVSSPLLPAVREKDQQLSLVAPARPMGHIKRQQQQPQLLPAVAQVGPAMPGFLVPRDDVLQPGHVSRVVEVEVEVLPGPDQDVHGARVTVSGHGQSSILITVEAWPVEAGDEAVQGEGDAAAVSGGGDEGPELFSMTLRTPGRRRLAGQVADGDAGRTVANLPVLRQYRSSPQLQAPQQQQEETDEGVVGGLARVRKQKPERVHVLVPTAAVAVGTAVQVSCTEITLASGVRALCTVSTRVTAPSCPSGQPDDKAQVLALVPAAQGRERMLTLLPVSRPADGGHSSGGSSIESLLPVLQRQQTTTQLPQLPAPSRRAKAMEVEVEVLPSPEQGLLGARVTVAGRSSSSVIITVEAWPVEMPPAAAAVADEGQYAASGSTPLLLGEGAVATAARDTDASAVDADIAPGDGGDGASRPSLSRLLQQQRKRRDAAGLVPPHVQPDKVRVLVPAAPEEAGQEAVQHGPAESVWTSAAHRDAAAAAKSAEAAAGFKRAAADFAATTSVLRETVSNYSQQAQLSAKEASDHSHIAAISLMAASDLKREVDRLFEEIRKERELMASDVDDVKESVRIASDLADSARESSEVARRAAEAAQRASDDAVEEAEECIAAARDDAVGQVLEARDESLEELADTLEAASQRLLIEADGHVESHLGDLDAMLRRSKKQLEGVVRSAEGGAERPPPAALSAEAAAVLSAKVDALEAALAEERAILHALRATLQHVTPDDDDGAAADPEYTEQEQHVFWTAELDARDVVMGRREKAAQKAAEAAAAASRDAEEKKAAQAAAADGEVDVLEDEVRSLESEAAATAAALRPEPAAAAAAAVTSQPELVKAQAAGVQAGVQDLTPGAVAAATGAVGAAVAAAAMASIQQQEAAAAAEPAAAASSPAAASVVPLGLQSIRSAEAPQLAVEASAAAAPAAPTTIPPVQAAEDAELLAELERCLEEPASEYVPWWREVDEDDDDGEVYGTVVQKLFGTDSDDAGTGSASVVPTTSAPTVGLLHAENDADSDDSLSVQVGDADDEEVPVQRVVDSEDEGRVLQQLPADTEGPSAVTLFFERFLAGEEWPADDSDKEEEQQQQPPAGEAQPAAGGDAVERDEEEEEEDAAFWGFDFDGLSKLLGDDGEGREEEEEQGGKEGGRPEEEAAAAARSVLGDGDGTEWYVDDGGDDEDDNEVGTAAAGGDVESLDARAEAAGQQQGGADDDVEEAEGWLEDLDDDSCDEGGETSAPAASTAFPQAHVIDFEEESDEEKEDGASDRVPAAGLELEDDEDDDDNGGAAEREADGDFAGFISDQDAAGGEDHDEDGAGSDDDLFGEYYDSDDDEVEEEVDISDEDGQDDAYEDEAVDGDDEDEAVDDDDEDEAVEDDDDDLFDDDDLGLDDDDDLDGEDGDDDDVYEDDDGEQE